MKKVLALVLAVMMLATVAMAAPVVNPSTGANANTIKGFLPGEKIKINDSGIVTKGNEAATGSYVLAKDAPNSGEDTTYQGATIVKNINSTNYSISNIKYTEGKNLVESIKFNDAEDRVEIKLKQDYNKTNSSNLKMSFTLKGKKVGKTIKPANLDIEIDTDVGYTLVEKTLLIMKDESVKVGGSYDTTSDVFQGDGNDKYVWKVAKDDDATTDYGDLEFTAADKETDVSVRVYKNDKFYLYNNTDADSDILKAYADTDADISFLNFPGEPTFNATAKVYFFKEEDSFIYGVKDGKLVNVNAKWDDDEGCFILKTRTLGTYVFSDKKLSVSAATTASQNPDTGANDVVGIAAALAAVALVSAAAVSLKK